jgi:uncharacterized protein YgiM (DUF1202 family)
MSDTSKTITSLNVRAAPEVTPTNIIETLSAEEPCTADGNVNKWLHIKHNGKHGFVNGDFMIALQPISPAPLWITNVTSDGLNLRDGPAMQRNVVGTLAKGDQLEVFGHTEGWLSVRHNGQQGFVACNRTSSMDSSISSQEPGRLGELMRKPKLTTSEMVDARTLIHAVGQTEKQGDLFEALQAKTAYRNQRDNNVRDANGNLVETRSGQMCNLTSLAMCLSYLGIFNPHPDRQFEDVLEQVRIDNHLPARTEAKGWGGVAAKMSAIVTFLGSNVTENQDWYAQHVLPSLRAGQAVMMSACGHIVRVQAVTNEGLIIDDPYGRGRMKPNSGCTDLKWEYAAFNEYQTPNQTVGEDNVWAWDDVSKHCMRWIAEISRVGFGIGEPLPPDEEFVDNGIVVPNQVN